jgi:hypothetical protein
MSDFQEQVLEARQTWEALVEYVNTLSRRLDELEDSDIARTSYDLLRSCAEALEQVRKAQHTLGAAKAHQIRMDWHASKFQKVRATMEDMDWKIRLQACETYQIWKTMELNCNKQVEQAHMASQVWEVLQVQSSYELFVQNRVTLKAMKSVLYARKKTRQAAKTLKTANDHLVQLEAQYAGPVYEHGLRVEEAWFAWNDARKLARQAHDRLTVLEARLEV